ncbi:MAG: deoxyribonuclease IV [Firmicutes bacterium]|nr:deoxyribonuclease IV [Bacillota bacterium]
MRLGVHLPLKGGFAANLKRVKNYGCETIQIFAGNPTAWKMAAPNHEEINKRVSLARELSVYPVVIHSAYLINLASRSPDFHEKSISLLDETMMRASLYGAPYVVLHVGNHGGAGIEPGLEQVVATISRSLPGWPDGVKLLLENTAGGGTALGSSLEELAHVLNSFPKGTLGVCLDTAHGWAAGYDFGSAEGVKEFLEQFERCMGLENLCVLHMNDAKVARGSRVDRHEHIGLGQIGVDGFRELLRQSWAPEMPAILETPEMGSDWDRRNLEALRSLLQV